MITGLGSADCLEGGDGDDRIDAADGVADTVDCGPGSDRVDADPEDVAHQLRDRPAAGRPLQPGLLRQRRQRRALRQPRQRLDPGRGRQRRGQGLQRARLPRRRGRQRRPRRRQRQGSADRRDRQRPSPGQRRADDTSTAARAPTRSIGGPGRDSLDGGPAYDRLIARQGQRHDRRRRRHPRPDRVREGPRHGRRRSGRADQGLRAGSPGEPDGTPALDFLGSFARPTAQRRPAKIKAQTARDGWEVSMQELPTVQTATSNLPGSSGGLTPEEIAELTAEVKELAKQRDAVILAHNYELPELQDVADFVGDSLGLSRAAAATDSSVIAFCGVHFMAETASVLSPEKTVLIPDLGAGCSLADSITAEQLRGLEGGAPGCARRHVREHLGRGQGRDRLLLHLLERGRRRRSHLAGARSRDGDPLRPGHVARRVRRARDGTGRRSRAPCPLPRLGRRVPRPRRYPPRRHHRDASRASRRRVPDPPGVRLLDPGHGVRRVGRRLQRGRPHALDLGDAPARRAEPEGLLHRRDRDRECSTRSSRPPPRPT